MHPIQELKKLLSNTSSKQTGRVLRVDNGNVYVATDKGVLVKAQNSATNYLVGDEVVLVSGELAGKQLKDSERITFVI